MAQPPAPQPPSPSPNVYFCRSLLGLVPGLIPSYVRKCFTKRIKNWNLSPVSSTHPQGALMEAGLGSAYYRGPISALRAYRLASNHIRPCTGIGNQTLAVYQQPPSRGRIHIIEDCWK